MLDKEKANRIEIRKTNKGRNYKVFYFNCLDCEGPIKAQLGHLRRHSGKCISCSHRGIPYKHIYNELKNHRNSKTDMSLTYEEFLSIIDNPKCHYCGVKMFYNKHSKSNGESISRAYQLDRKDNKMGYTLSNLVTYCWECNRLKSDRFTYSEFILLSPILTSIMNDRLINK